MRTRITTAPTEVLLALPLVKTYLRVSHASEDAVISSMVSAAMRHCENHARMSFMVQTREMTFDLPLSRIDEFRLARRVDDPDGLLEGAALVRGPIKEVKSVVVEVAGEDRVVSADFYSLQKTKARVLWKAGFWEMVRGLTDFNSSQSSAPLLRISYECGLTASDFQATYPDVVDAVMSTVQNMYENRGTLYPIPAAAQAILGQYWTSYTNRTA
jgi:uncharacterized phiE125 gp8 family phage protein